MLLHDFRCLRVVVGAAAADWRLALTAGAAWLAIAASYWPVVSFYRLPPAWTATLPLAAALFQLIPTPVRSPQKRNIIRMLVVGFADYPCLAVRAAARVHQPKLLDSQHAATAACQLKSRRRPHTSQAEHNDVIRFHNLMRHPPVFFARPAQKRDEYAIAARRAKPFDGT